MRAYRRRIPRLEIELSLVLTWSFFAPRIAALSIAVRDSVRGAMKLCFRRQFAPQPFCIRCCFGMTYVYGPFQRQSNLAKHRSVYPEVAFAAPKHRVLHAFLCFPGPGFIAPERTVLISPGLYKPQKIVIRHVVIVDCEFVHRDFMSAKFVIPAELIVVNAVPPQRRGSSWNFHEVRLHAMRFPGSSFRSGNLAVARQPVQHVRQRFRLHQPVLNRYFQHGDQLRMPFFRPLQRMLDRAIQLFSQTPVVALDFFACRPIRRCIRWQSSVHRVNAKRKQAVEGPLKRPQSKRPLREQVPIKSLDVPDVKNKAVSLGDGPVVYRLFAHHAKYLIGARASVEQSVVKVVTDADSRGESSHGVFPFSWMQLPREGCAEFQRSRARVD